MSISRPDWQTGALMSEIIPDVMRVVEIAAAGGPEQLRLASRPTPRPGRGEVLVKVAAAGVNRPDVLQRKGVYPPPPGASDIPGLEIAGTVVAAGDGATHFIGTRVCALVSGGGYAEYCVAPTGTFLPIPEVLRLRNLSKGFDLTDFGKYRYKMFEVAGHWFPGQKADKCKPCGDCLPRCPQNLDIPALLHETHALLNTEVAGQRISSD